MSDARVRLNRLYRAYAADPAFAHLREGATGVVKGDGTTQPKFLFVGEAPGRNEDRLGKPFIGDSGKLLNELLYSVGLLRTDVFVTNAVKYRPVNERNGNRAPTTEEKVASLPYLKKEHELLGWPPLVVLGRHARSMFDELDPNTVLRTHDLVVGQWVPFGPTWMLPLHHPAYAIYQQKNRPLLFRHIKALLEVPSAR